MVNVALVVAGVSLIIYSIISMCYIIKYLVNIYGTKTD